MKTTPVICSGSELETVLADIRSRGGVVTALSTGVGGNSGYSVSYFESVAELAQPVAVRQDVDGKYCHQVNNPAALNPVAGSTSLISEVAGTSERERKMEETPPATVNPSIEERMAALHARMSATGKLIRSKPREWRLPYAD